LESILEGITRTTLLDIAKDNGLRTKIGPITKKELFEADEVFFSGTAVEITPIILVADGSEVGREARSYPIGDGRMGEVTQRLAEDYQAACCGLLPQYHKWLTYVEPAAARPEAVHSYR
jgi:branched-chain amino acid aminotransferase